ncbi:MAG: DUF86 domain-containing protein [Desulfobacterota bacterium]|nr:DUF86 domain-containing protein [Thermodesulfobacteriota bacterium]
MGRRLEIIGEAAKGVSSGIMAELPDLPWKRMVGMRDMMIREYDDVDSAIVWDTVKIDGPL